MNNLDGQGGTDILMTLRDKDVFFNPLNVPQDMVWKDRPTGKIVLFDKDNRIALIGNKVNDFFLLPGGGIEGSESILDGLKRECLEETGCQIEIQSTLGITEDFRMREEKHCINYGYSGRVISLDTPTLTKNEKDIGAYVKWFVLSEAVDLFEQQEKKVRAGEVKFYNTCFNIIRDFFFIKRAQALL